MVRGAALRAGPGFWVRSVPPKKNNYFFERGAWCGGAGRGLAGVKFGQDSEAPERGCRGGGGGAGAWGSGAWEAGSASYPQGTRSGTSSVLNRGRSDGRGVSTG